MGGRSEHKYIIRLQAQGGRIVDATLETTGRKGERAFQRIGDAATRANGRVSLFANTILRRLVPAFLGFRAASSLNQSIQTFEKLNLRLKRLTDGADDFAKTQDYLRDKARELNIDLITLTNSYSNLLALQDAGILNRDQVNELAEGFANLKAALGVGDEQIADVLYGLSQALSQGQVQAQELNQVIEPVPGFLNKIAEAAGTTAGAYRQMVKDGQISSEVFRNHILKALEEYKGAASELEGTATEGFTELKNAWRNLGAELERAGFGEKLNEITGMLTDIIELSGDAVAALRRVFAATKADQLAAIDDRLRELYQNPRGGLFADTFLGDLEAPMRSAEMQRLLAERRQLVGGIHLEERTASTNQRRARGETFGTFGPLGPNPPVPGQKPQAIYDRRFKLEEEAQKLAKQRADGINKIVEALRFENEQLGRTSEEQAIYNELQRAGVERDSARGQEIENLVRQNIELKKAVEEAAEATENFNSLADEFGDAWGNAADKVADDFDNLGDAAEHLLRDLKALFFRELVSDPIRETATSLFKSFAGDIFGGFRAGGGPVSAGKSYVVGEREPELFTPGQNGMITPMSALGRGDLNIKIINQTQNQVQGRVSRGNGGRDVEVILTEIVQKSVSRGALDDPMQTRYGITPSSFQR